MPYVYILKSINYPKIYIGSTVDLDRRVKEHNAGKGYSNRYKPWRVVYSEEIDDLKLARKREKYLKSAAGRKYIKKQKIIFDIPG